METLQRAPLRNDRDDISIQDQKIEEKEDCLPIFDRRGSVASVILVIDLSQQIIVYKGITVVLTPIPFKFLVVLGRTPGRVVKKEILYDAVYGSADARSDDDRPYERQLADHKRKVLTQIHNAVAGAGETRSDEIKKLIGVRRGVGYTLSLHPAEVLFVPASL
ncbi:MAG: hypothetical protein WBK96_04605 [Candidatus Manganitrophaceae bacterium]